MIGEYEDDAHICLKCHTTIIGLDNYVNHRKNNCAQITNHPEDASFNRKADDFFSSLELQSSTKKPTVPSTSGKSFSGILTRSKTSAAIKINDDPQKSVGREDEAQRGKGLFVQHGKEGDGTCSRNVKEGETHRSKQNLKEGESHRNKTAVIQHLKESESHRSKSMIMQNLKESESHRSKSMIVQHLKEGESHRSKPLIIQNVKEGDAVFSQNETQKNRTPTSQNTKDGKLSEDHAMESSVSDQQTIELPTSTSGKNAWIGGHQLKLLGHEDNQTRLINAVDNLSRHTYLKRESDNMDIGMYDDSDEDSDDYDYDEDEYEEEDDDDARTGGKWKHEDFKAPPRSFTGGKWKPASPIGDWNEGKGKYFQNLSKETVELNESAHIGGGKWSKSDVPPSNHTKGKWKPGKAELNPPPGYSKGKWKPGKDAVPPPDHTKGKWKPSKDAIPPPEHTKGKWKPPKDAIPPADYTKGKWKPSKEAVPPPEHTKGKWKPCKDAIPPADYTKGKWKPGAMKEKTEERFPPPGHTKGKWKPIGFRDKDKDNASKPADVLTKSELIPPPGHTKGKWKPERKHKVKEEELPAIRKSNHSVQYWCGPCNRRLASKIVYHRHLKSELHFKRMQRERELDDSSNLNETQTTRRKTEEGTSKESWSSTNDTECTVKESWRIVEDTEAKVKESWRVVEDTEAKCKESWSGIEEPESNAKESWRLVVDPEKVGKDFWSENAAKTWAGTTTETSGMNTSATDGQTYQESADGGNPAASNTHSEWSPNKAEFSVWVPKKVDFTDANPDWSINKVQFINPNSDWSPHKPELTNPNSDWSPHKPESTNPNTDWTQNKPEFTASNSDWSPIKVDIMQDVKRLRKKKFTICSVCKSRVTSQMMGKHLISHYHCRKADLSTREAQKLILDNINGIVLQSPYQCAMCRYYFNTHEDFLQHWKTASHEESVVKRTGYLWCSFCKFSCSDNTAMYVHLTSHEHLEVISVINKSVPIVINKITPISCGTCSRSFVLNVQLRKHCEEENHTCSGTASDEYQRNIYCNLCESVFKSAFALQRHIKKEHNAKIFFCSACDVNFDSAADAVKHRSGEAHRAKIQKPVAKSCEYCEIVLGSFAAYKKHLQEDHSDRTHSCPHCGKSFTLPQEVTVHLRSKSCAFAQTKSENTCDHCPYSSNSVSDLLYHKTLHGNAASNGHYQCPLCEKAFAKQSLKFHIRNHLGERAYVCGYCGAKYARKNNWKAHQKRHLVGKVVKGVAKVARDEVFQCEVCEATFKQKSTLNNHMIIHTGKKFKCTIANCFHTSRSAAELKLHEKVHSDEKTFKCSSCEYVGKTKQHLRRHEVSHEDVKKYKCSKCSFTARFAFHLKRHELVHTGAKPYACPHCDYKCNTIENLRKHVLSTNKHPGKRLYECKFCEDRQYRTNFAKDFRLHLITDHRSVFGSGTEATGYIAGIYDNKPRDSALTTPDGGVLIAERATPSYSNINKGDDLFGDEVTCVDKDAWSIVASFDVEETSALVSFNAEEEDFFEEDFIDH